MCPIGGPKARLSLDGGDVTAPLSRNLLPSSNRIRITEKTEYSHKRAQKMEAFKDVEREAKTKNYSKEGLMNANKLDPREKERRDVREWIADSIDRMEQINEQLDASLDELLIGMKKVKSKDKAKNEANKKAAALKSLSEKNKFHLAKFEGILRMLDNDNLDLMKVNGIKDDFEYYLDKANDGENESIDYIYDDLVIDEIPGEC